MILFRTNVCLIGFTKFFIFLVKRMCQIIFVIHLKLPGSFLKFWDLGALGNCLTRLREGPALVAVLLCSHPKNSRFEKVKRQVRTVVFSHNDFIIVV